MSAPAQEIGGLAAAEAGSGYRRVGSATALLDGGRLLVTLDGQSIVVFSVQGRLVAIPAECPHAGGPICDGELSGKTLSCPWHGYNFDLHTGACEDDEELTLQRFDIRIAGDDILVKL
jgi:nitrite reductase (NADH) small subunit